MPSKLFVYSEFVLSSEATQNETEHEFTISFYDNARPTVFCLNANSTKPKTGKKRNVKKK